MELSLQKILNKIHWVIGSISYSSLPNSSEVFLHRFFIKSKLKNKGLGSKLLYFVEDYLKKLGKTKIRIHLGQPKNQWIESYYFYQRKGYKFYKKNFLQKNLDTN
ncbi:Pai1 protein [Lactococcus lactis subsp. lactis]|uniref:GNAT family N-acetyltransferase n=1 Tax=Lactococcus lactis TaxID=1358 RepID=UPI00071C5D5B|nr:GNAT family N-acetyltransferase [Lactococcus lactis]KST82228.1 Pai1 protein [Lactococcus lactis subsp. lactis]